MCGIAGFSGITGDTLELAWLLGLGIDTRGGHAAGFVSVGAVNARGVQIGRKLGHWATASDKFLWRASEGHTAMLHARFATSGGRTVAEAHPFEIVRHGAPVLWGVHNGCLYNAGQSAAMNGRVLNVDSAELFELLADGDLEGIQALEGYGVVTWVEASHPGHVNLARLSDDGAIYVCDVSGGGSVWGSTRDIVEGALAASGLESVKSYKLETGRVYQMSPAGIYATNERGVKVADRVYSPVSYRDGYLQDEEDELFDMWLASDSPLSFDAWLDLSEEDAEREEWERERLESMWEESELRRDEQRDAEQARIAVLRGETSLDKWMRAKGS
jgi:glutamine amidotransferase-like protein